MCDRGSCQEQRGIMIQFRPLFSAQRPFRNAFATAGGRKLQKSGHFSCSVAFTFSYCIYFCNSAEDFPQKSKVHPTPISSRVQAPMSLRPGPASGPTHLSGHDIHRIFHNTNLHLIFFSAVLPIQCPAHRFREQKFDLIGLKQLHVFFVYHSS